MRPAAVLASIFLLLTQAPLAYGMPGPPQAPGGACDWCTGPPPPPTPVPTVSAPVEPQQFVVDVAVWPQHVRVRQILKIQTTSVPDEFVTIEIHYKNDRSATYRGMLGDDGTYLKEWRVPKDAATGKGTISVTVWGPDITSQQAPGVYFEVVK